MIKSLVIFNLIYVYKCLDVNVWPKVKVNADEQLAPIQVRILRTAGNINIVSK